MKKKLWYFGCIGQVGHYLWEGQNRSAREESIAVEFNINPGLFKHIDGTFPPQHSQHEFIYSDNLVPPFRILSWWDRTVDKRPGSSSTFIAFGYESVEEILKAASEQYPSVMKRQQPLIPYEKNFTISK